MAFNAPDTHLYIVEFSYCFERRNIAEIMAHGCFGVCACSRMTVLGALGTTKMKKKGAHSIRHYRRHST